MLSGEKSMCFAEKGEMMSQVCELSGGVWLPLAFSPCITNVNIINTGSVSFTAIRSLAVMTSGLYVQHILHEINFERFIPFYKKKGQ